MEGCVKSWKVIKGKEGERDGRREPFSDQFQANPYLIPWQAPRGLPPSGNIHSLHPVQASQE